MIISDEGDSVWAYLSYPGSLRPERDCWLLNKPSAAQDPVFAPYRAANLPPPALARTIDPARIIAAPKAGEWRVRWSTAGEAAVIAVDGVDVGLLAVSEPRGMARYLLESGPWRIPWDSRLVARFGLKA